MKTICVLLNGEIKNDSRVIKTIRTFSINNRVDLYYIDGFEGDKEMFNHNVKLFNVRKKNTFKNKIVKHSCFYNEFNFFVKEVLKQNTQYDFVYANDLPCLKPAAKIKKKLECKLIYDSHEIYIETLNQFFTIKATIIKSFIFFLLLSIMKFLGKRAERKLLKQTDHFITVGNELKKYFEKKYSFHQIQVVMNCPELNTLQNPIDLKTLLGLKQKDKLFIYQGILNYGRGLPLMIQACKHVHHDIYLLILGSGMIKNELIAETKKLQLEHKVFFLDLVDLSELQSHTRGADYGINLLEIFNMSQELAAPNKLFEYIHAQLPVISSNMPESITIYNKYNIGLLVNNVTEEIADAMNTLSQSNIENYKNNCKLAAMEYNWQNQEKVLLEIIEQ